MQRSGWGWCSSLFPAQSLGELDSDGVRSFLSSTVKLTAGGRQWRAVEFPCPFSATCTSLLSSLTDILISSKVDARAGIYC